MTARATVGFVLLDIAETSSEYNGAMRGWSFPVGRFFGVEVRIHAFFLLLLAMAIGVGSLAGASTGRVLTLWLLLLFAVAVREVARALAAAGSDWTCAEFCCCPPAA